MLARTLLILSFAIAAAHNSQAEEPVKIGAVLHLTGDLASQGAAFREGIELAVDEANSSGGINGRKVKAVFEDSRLLPAASVTAAKKLMQIDRISAALISSMAEAKSVGQLFEQARVPAIVMWDSSPELDAVGDYLFSIGTWAPSTGEKVASFARERLGAKKAAVVINHDEWALAVKEIFEEQFQAAGGAIVFAEILSPEEKDFRSLIARIKAAGPDVLFSPLGFNIITFFRQLREANVPFPVIEADNISGALLQEGGEIFEGVYQTLAPVPRYAETQSLASKYEARYGRQPALILFNAWGYDGARLLLESMRMNGVKGPAIKDGLYRVKDFTGASGLITISPEGSSRKEVMMHRVEDGKFVELRD